jgi:hypothetical protein
LYSYEARMRAVRLYIRYDRATAATVRELEYPSARMLQAWYREFIESGDLHQDYCRGLKYSNEQSRLAVEHYCNQRGPMFSLLHFREKVMPFDTSYFSNRSFVRSPLLLQRVQSLAAVGLQQILNSPFHLRVTPMWTANRLNGVITRGILGVRIRSMLQEKFC